MWAMLAIHLHKFSYAKNTLLYDFRIDLGLSQNIWKRTRELGGAPESDSDWRMIRARHITPAR